MISRRIFISTTLSAAIGAASPLERQRFSESANLSCPAANGAAIAFPDENAINTAIQKYIPGAPPNPGVVVGVASPSLGSRIFCIGSLVDQQGNSTSFTTDTPFEIASITKTFVATVYELFFQTGRLGHVKLGDYLDSQISSQVGNIPLLNLANYTSGLPADNINVAGSGTIPLPFPAAYSGDYTENDILEYLANPAFNISAPGSVYTYSNLAFSLLAFALETAVQTADFGQLMANELLIPLGMAKTQPYVSTLNAELPRGYTATGADATPGWPFFPGYWGAGGLVSTPNDLMTWLQFNMGIVRNKRLTEILPVLHAQGTMARALGWFLSTFTNPAGEKLTVVQKNGDLSGFSSQMAFLPATGCAPSNGGIFVLVNQNAPSTVNQSYASAITYDLLFTMAGLEPPSNLLRIPGDRDQNLTGPS